MKFNLCVVLLLLCGSMLVSRPAHAQSGEKEDGVVAVGGETLFRIYVPVDGKSITQRREAVEDNLVPILSEPKLTAADIRLTPFGGKLGVPKTQRVRIEVKKHFLINVWPEDGRHNGMTAMEQAKSWARQLSRKLPQVNYEPNPNVQKQKTGN